MATPPLTPPFWMFKVGSSNPADHIQITGIDGDGGAAQYTAALGLGYSLATTTPVPTGVPVPAVPSIDTTVTPSTMSGGTVIDENSINPAQPDPFQPVPPS